MTDTLKLWTVSTNSDLTEGRGREYIKHFCRLEATARRLARKGYVQGMDCPINVAEAISIDGKFFLPASMIKIEEPSNEDRAAEAFLTSHHAAVQRAKELGLSDEEIKLLAGAK